MAKLMLIGDVVRIELTFDPEDGQVIATCVEHSMADGQLTPPGNCSWTERYDTLDGGERRA